MPTKQNENLGYLRKRYQVRAIKSARMHALVFINVWVPEGIVSRLGSNTAYCLKLPVKCPEETVKVYYRSSTAFPNFFLVTEHILTLHKITEHTFFCPSLI